MDYQEMYQQQAQQQNNPPAPAKKPSPKELFEKYKKQIITGGVVVLALIVVLIIWLCSAFGSTHGEVPELDLRKAEKALKAADYSVTIETEDLEIGLKEEFYAWDEHYNNTLTISVYEDEKLAEKAYEAAKMKIDHTIEEAKLTISTAEFMLEKYSNELSSREIDTYKESIKELKETIEKYEESYVYGRRGNIIWAGTVNAAKDSKGI